jgi:hypothetical protein
MSSDPYGKLPNSQDEWEKDQKKTGRNAACVRYVVGLSSMLVCLATWQTMNEVINSLQEEFPKPYMITWVLHNGYLVFMVLFLPILWLIQCARGSPCLRFSFKDFLWAALFNTLLISSDYMWVLALGNPAVLPALTSVCACLRACVRRVIRARRNQPHAECFVRARRCDRRHHDPPPRTPPHLAPSQRHPKAHPATHLTPPPLLLSSTVIRPSSTRAAPSCTSCRYSSSARS